MKRFVVFKKFASEVVIDIKEAASTLDAVSICKTAKLKIERAEWYKAETLDELAEHDPYVRIYVLEQIIRELQADADPDKVEEEPRKDPRLFFSNGRPKKPLPEKPNK